KYSWVAPGPPCSSSSLIFGLLPMRFVQTRNCPLGVEIGIIRAPPPRTSARPALSKYDDALVEPVAAGGVDCAHAAAVAIHPAGTHRMVCVLCASADVNEWPLV